MPEIILKPGREKALQRHHPWIFSGAIDHIIGEPKIGETVEIISSKGEFLARAAYNQNSSIVGRVWTWDSEEQIDRVFFEKRILNAIKLRQNLSSLISSNAMRLVHGESDFIPGLILDRYGGVYVVQFLTAGVEYWKTDIIEVINTCTDAEIIYERSDVDVRQLEGLPNRIGLLQGEILINPIEILENKAKFLVDVVEGQKTGFYLDQRDNRLLAREIAYGKTVLDCFSYTGGFAINCVMGKAKKVTLVDSSRMALEIARKNVLKNNLPADSIEFVEQDVFTYLRMLRDHGASFDLVILDPPKFAPTTAQVERAARGYKDINLLALKILNKGGYLLTFSCSGGVNEELFQKIIAGAALDAGVDAQIIRRLHQALDHPVALNFPEGSYLKGFLIQKVA